MPIEAQKTAKIILCVDDDPDTCELVIVLLQSAGIQVDIAQSVAEGCRKAQTNHYDLILLDSRLSDGSGKELCQCVRQFNEQIPILFYSAEAHQEKIDLALAAGAQDYLVKPEDTEYLVERVLFHTRSDQLA